MASDDDAPKVPRGRELVDALRSLPRPNPDWLLKDAPCDLMAERVESIIDAIVNRQHIRDVLSTVAAEARREALEEAAVLCDEASDAAHTKDQYEKSYAYEGAAAAIRALKDRA